MNEDTGKEFVAYEYKKIRFNADMLSFVIDGYKNFGWKLDENVPNSEEIYRYMVDTGNKQIEVRMKRDRNLVNKMELTRLQRNFDACVKDVTQMEQLKTSGATLAAIIMGIFGTICMAGATFAVTADTPIIWLTVLLAVPGFAGWIFPMFLYKSMVRKQEKKLQPLIEKKYDEMVGICEKGHHLLYN